MKIKANYNLIKKSAYDVINKLQYDASGQSAQKTYKTYLTEGKLAPGYAISMMQTAKFDQFWQSTQKVIKGDMTSQNYNERKINISNGLMSLFLKNQKKENELDIAGKTMYPKTWVHRRHKGLSFNLPNDTPQLKKEYVFD